MVGQRSATAQDSEMGTDFYSTKLPDDSIEFKFPDQDVGLGVIGWEGPYSVPAVGAIKVPPGKHVLFVAGPLLARRPDLMRKFRATDLSYLNLPSKSLWTGENFQEIGRLKALQGLDLANVTFRPEFFQYLNDLPNLTSLDISVNGISGDDLAKFAGLGRLTQLNADRLDNMSAVLLKLRGNNVLADLSLKGCGLTDDDLKDLATITSLKSLTIDFNTFTVKGLRHLTALPHLEILRMEADAIGPESIGVLSKFKYLNHLRMQTVSWGESDKAALKKALPADCVMEELP
jgi:hypothetical protein